jgi:hypothetical protein
MCLEAKGATMKKIEAVADGYRTEQFLTGATRGGGHISYYLDVVSDTTRAHERLESDRFACFENKPRSWVRYARNQIAFRHDTKRGPMSATLPHAVY